MAHGPDPHGDFVVAEDGTSVIAEDGTSIIAEDGTSYPTDDQGVDYPIGEDDADGAHQPGSGAVSGLAGDEVTADILQPPTPLRARFGSQERGA